MPVKSCVQIRFDCEVLFEHQHFQNQSHTKSFEKNKSKNYDLDEPLLDARPVVRAKTIWF